MGTLAQHAAKYLLERRGRQEITRSTGMRISYTLRSLDKSFGDRPLALFGARAIERWSEQNPHWKRSTRNTYLSAVREFCRWLRKRKLIKSDPFAEMVMPRRPRPSPRPLPRADIAALLAAVPDSRARLIIHLQWGLGLRCIGCANLKVEDIDVVAKSVHVTEKGGHQRMLPLTNEVYGALDRYLWDHPATSGPLLRSFTDPWAGLGAAHIGNMIRRWMTTAGIKRRPWDGVSAHALRRTALTETAVACGDAFVVAELAGWASISTAAHYVRRATTERVRAALEAR